MTLVLPKSERIRWETSMLSETIHLMVWSRVVCKYVCNPIWKMHFYD